MTGGEQQKISIEDVFNLIKQVNENILTKIENINGTLQALSTKVDSEIREVNKKVELLETENKDLKAHLKETERKLRKRNLVFYGINEEGEENESDLIVKIKNLVEEKLQIRTEYTDITNIFRLGKKSEKTRPILVEFLTQFIRKNILINRGKLKGTKIFIVEDLIPEDREVQKLLTENLKEARKLNKSAKIKGNKLIINGNTYTYDDLKACKHPSTNSSHSTSQELGQAINTVTPKPLNKEEKRKDIPPIIEITQGQIQIKESIENFKDTPGRSGTVPGKIVTTQRFSTRIKRN